MKNTIESKKQPKFWENLWVYLFCLSVGLIVIVTIALFKNKNDLALAIISAVLGVVMTTFATFFLFKGQAKHQNKLIKAQQESDNETEKFKERLASYKSFLNALCDYVEADNSRNQSKRTILTFRTAALGMHTTNSKMASINNDVAEILDLNPNDDNYELKLLNLLFKISDTFNRDLYHPLSKDIDYTLTEVLSESIKKLAENLAKDEKEDNNLKSEAEEIEKEEKEIASLSDRDLPKWNSFINDILSRGWNSQIDKDSIEIKNSNYPYNIVIRRPKKGTYIIECLSVNDDKEAIKNLQEKIGAGRRNGVTWWKQLNSLPSYGVKNGELLMELEGSNLKARALIIKWIEKLIKEIS